MNVKEAIYARRAVRAFARHDLDEATVRELLRAAVQAPSAMNEQPWLFVVVQDRARLRSLSDRAKALLVGGHGGVSGSEMSRYDGLLRDPAFDVFYDAGTLIVIGAQTRSAFVDADCWLAAENLMLEACELGLGTCPIGFALPLLNTPEVKTELGLPPDACAIAAIIVGRPAAAAAPVPRAEPRVVAWLRHAGAAPTKAA